MIIALCPECGSNKIYIENTAGDITVFECEDCSERFTNLDVDYADSEA